MSNRNRITLGLSPMLRWEGFHIEWGGRGMLICARTRRTGARVEA